MSIIITLLPLLECWEMLSILAFVINHFGMDPMVAIARSDTAPKAINVPKAIKST